MIKCPNCQAALDAAWIAKQFAAMRTKPGRRRTDSPRCPCNLMTVARAKARAHHCTKADEITRKESQ